MVDYSDEVKARAFDLLMDALKSSREFSHREIERNEVSLYSDPFPNPREITMRSFDMFRYHLDIVGRHNVEEQILEQAAKKMSFPYRESMHDRHHGTSSGRSVYRRDSWDDQHARPYPDNSWDNKHRDHIMGIERMMREVEKSKIKGEYPTYIPKTKEKKQVEIPSTDESKPFTGVIKEMLPEPGED